MRRTDLGRIGGVVALTCLALIGPGATRARADISESWDAVFIAGARVGQIHTYIEPVEDKGRKLNRIRVDMKIRFKRGADTVTMELMYGTIETPDGEVLKLDTRTVAADTVLRGHGDVVDGKMLFKFSTGSNEQTQVIPWSPDVRGPYAPEQSLARKPMEAGEERDLKMFVPDLNKICLVHLKAIKKEEVELGGKVKRTLMRVEQTTSLDGKARKEFDVTVFVDDTGQILKSVTDQNGGMAYYRTTREGSALPDVAAAGQFDQIQNSVIKITRPLANPEKTRSVRYKITLKEDNPSEVITADRRQTVTPGSNANEVTLVVKTAGPNVGEAGPETVDPSFLRPNTYINSDNSQVINRMRTAVGTLTDPWEKVKRIEKWVAENIKDKNFKTTFAPASEVAVNLSGDCTEHGVLTAAMCRATGIPAKVVVGLVYAKDLKGFGYHLWNEVYINRRWVAIDSTFDEIDVDAVHIKLSETGLDGASPFETFLPIVRVLGKMSIDVIETR